MFLWLKENIGTIVIGAALLGAVAAIVVRLILRVKAGKRIGCEGCDGCKSAYCGQRPDIKSAGERGGCENCPPPMCAD